MTTFYLCRHGETENNKHKRLSGWIDSPLTSSGEEQAQALAQKLKGVHFDHIISSDLGRAFITAYIISKGIGYTSPIDRLQGLREVNYGQLANMPYDAYPQLTPAENTHFAPVDGESLEQMQRRVLDCVAEIGQANRNKTVLIVAHDGTINAIRAGYTQESMGEADLVRNPHDQVVLFTWENSTTASFSVL